MRPLADIRRENVRRLFAEHGGVSKVSKALGYANPSLMSQTFGPNPTRPANEPLVRKMEVLYGKPAGYLDVDRSGTGRVQPLALPTAYQPAAAPHSPAPAASDDSEALVRLAMGKLHTLLDAEGVKANPVKFAMLMHIALADPGDRRLDERLQQMVSLLK